MEVDSAPQPGQSDLEGGQTQHAPSPVVGGSPSVSRGGYHRACRDDGIPGPKYDVRRFYSDAPYFTMAGRSPLPRADRNLTSSYSGMYTPEVSPKHRRSPAYSFGIRLTQVHHTCSPGPSYYLHQGMYRDGREGSPHYSLYSRPKDTGPFRTPGPGAYTPEVAAHKPRAPKYSFGTKPCPYPSVFLPEATESSND